MTYKIIVAAEAQKSLRKVPKAYISKIERVIAVLKFDPFIGKKLEGRYKNKYSIRAWPYRIIYKIYKNQLIVEVIEITHRGGAYRK